MANFLWMCRVTLVGLLIVGLIGCSAKSGTTNNVSGGGSPKLQQAQKAVADKKYTDAVKLCDEVIATDPNNAEAYKVRGLARMSIPYVPRPAPPKPKWTDPRQRYAPEPEWLGRMPALNDLMKASELRGNKDPVVWYLRSVFHTTEAQLSKGEVQEIRQAMEALQEAEKLDPKQPAYRRARELLEPQMYFAKRDAHQDESPYTGQYADVIPLGAKEPYGETMKRYGWVPGTAWTRPAPKARQGDAGTSSGSYDPEDSTTYILLGIGALFVIGAIGQGGSGGRTGGSGQSPCFTCGGQGRVSYWNGVTNRIEWYRCRACWGRIP